MPSSSSSQGHEAIDAIMSMKLVAISVGKPTSARWQRRNVQTSIFKTPVAGRVHVRTTNIDGDAQADPRVHGGFDKAVYAYPAEHYRFWRDELPDAELSWGSFGENFTTEGLLENDVSIGDRYRVGNAELMVTQPRMPCFKLAIRFGRPDIVKRFLKSRRTGFYLSVAREGDAAAGDAIERITRDERRLTVGDVVSLYGAKSADRLLLQIASEHPALPPSWREHFRKRL